MPSDLVVDQEWVKQNSERIRWTIAQADAQIESIDRRLAESEAWAERYRETLHRAGILPGGPRRRFFIF